MRQKRSLRRALGTLLALGTFVAMAGPTGDRAGNGGDPLAGEVVGRGYFVYYALKTRNDMALLSPVELEKFKLALRTTRIEFVHQQLFDNDGREVPSIVLDDSKHPGAKLVRINKKEWLEDRNSHEDLVRHSFHEYLRAIGKYDDNFVVSIHLTVTEKDYQTQPPADPDCLSRHYEPIGIDFNIALSFPGLDQPLYVNGIDIDSKDQTSFRVFRSAAVCTANPLTFEVRIAGFSRKLVLYGGDNVVVMVPDELKALPAAVDSSSSSSSLAAPNRTPADELNRRLGWWQSHYPQYLPRQ